MSGEKRTTQELSRNVRTSRELYWLGAFATRCYLLYLARMSQASRGRLKRGFGFYVALRGRR